MKMQENPLYEKFRNNGLPFANELTTLFKDTVANGEYTWAPSCGVLSCVFENDDNDVMVVEGSGDSEDASASSKIAEAVSLIAKTCRSGNDVAGNASIGEVMVELQTISEVSNDLYLHG